MIDTIDFLADTVKEKHFLFRKNLVEQYLECSSITPIWDFENPDADGAVGHSVCPHSHLHSDTDDRPDVFRIWIDRKDPKTRISKVFFSCRHESCNSAVWSDCLRVRLAEEGRSNNINFSETKSEPDPAYMLKQQAVNQHRIVAADKGRELYRKIIKQTPRTDTTLSALQELSPIKTLLLDSYGQMLLHLSMYSRKDYLWIGDVQDAQNPRSIKPAFVWEQLITQDREFLKNIIGEPEESWPCRGPFISCSSYVDPALGRNDDNVLSRFYSVCEADYDPEEPSNKMPIYKQVALAMYLIKSTKRVVSVVHSGSKSLHIHIKGVIPQATADMMTGVPRSQVGLVTPANIPQKARYGGMGFDPAPLLNISQPVRLSGHFRQNTNKRQYLLYFDPSVINTPIPT